MSSKSIGDEVADHLAHEKEIADAIERNTRQLYMMKCFDTIGHPEGWPMVTRVPGGWIWYMRSGGVSIATTAGGVRQQQVVGNPVLMPVFVPFDNEFMADTSRTKQ